MLTSRYGTAPSQVGDLHLPDVRNPPVICLFHGGFWRMPYGYDQMTPLAEDLMRRGWAAWNLEYRRIGEAGAGWPGTFQDVHAGIEHLARLKADGADLDLARVVAVGHSAGGQLALWAAGPRRLDTQGSLPQVRLMGAVGQAPAADLKRVYELGSSNGVAGELMGGSPQQVPERYALASPPALLPLGVPQLIVHGSTDDVVLRDMGREYAAAARAAGDSADYVELPGVGHFEHLDPAGTAWTQVVAWLARLF
jgi:acetyl esterase/lipase